MKPSEYAARLTKEIETKADVRRIFNKDVLQTLGSLVIAKMNDLIRGGHSPIEGKGNFPAYKNPKKYPGKKKLHNPVNLSLTGQMLNSLRYRINQQKVIVTILYVNKKAAVKEQGHREGANAQPKRPTIPIKNEKFHSSITIAIDQFVNRVLKRASTTFKS